MNDALIDRPENFDSELINDLRRLRLDARRLNSSLVERLRPFQKRDGFFKTLPDSSAAIESDKAPGKPDISVASTCTVLMAAIAGDKIGEDTETKLFTKDTLRQVFTKSVVHANWGSSGLPDGNGFTTAILVRSAAFVAKSGTMSSEEIVGLRHERDESGNEGVANKTIKEIVEQKAPTPEASFAVMGYPPKPTHGYWFVDGAIGLRVALAREVWDKLASWAAAEFHRELTYVSAGNDSLMDPPSLAMAACLINRIRRFCDEDPDLADVSRKLPSLVELDFGIEQVFSQQSDSGIWQRYFPLFHFPKGQGAADYCFSFEFLESVLTEFGLSVLRKPELLERVKRVVSWCDRHELEFKDPTGLYSGWNSGGEVRSLAAGKAESWATASVHMFLIQLERRISDLLDEIVLAQRFSLDRRAVIKSPKKFDELIDIRVTFPDELPTTLKTVIKDELIANAQKNDSEKLVEVGLSVPRSALLFGPPGTSKTYLAKAIAEYIGWPLVVVTPSEFLSKGLEQVHSQVDEVFRDLMDLREAIVFFDEMDALAQTREGEILAEDGDGRLARFLHSITGRGKGGGELDVTRQLLTTSMLPKLANLWDQKRVIFLMATNHKQQLDPAITRPSRFDLLLCVAPASWEAKSKADRLTKPLAVKQSKDVETELMRLAPLGSDSANLLDTFTVSEVGIFLDHLCRRRKDGASLLTALHDFKDEAAFAPVVSAWAETSITLRGRRTREEFDKDKNESRRQYYPGQK